MSKFQKPCLFFSFIETNTMSESGDQLFNDLTNTPKSPHQAPGKKRCSGRVRCTPFVPIEYGLILIYDLFLFFSYIETDTMSESGDELSNDLTSSPQSSHQASGKKRRSRRVRCTLFTSIWIWSDIDIRTPNSPYSPSTKKGAKTKSKSKENLTKLVTGKVRATRKQVLHLVLVCPKIKVPSLRVMPFGRSTCLCGLFHITKL